VPPPELPRRERELPPFERELLLRGLAAPVERFAAVLRVPVDLRAVPDLTAVPDLRAVDERLAPELDGFARDVVFFVPVERFAVERDVVDLRVPDDFRAPLDRVELPLDADDPELALPVVAPSIDHLPDITRCAASATASAMIEPSLVALETTLLAARSAVSAASSPASRIFLRAAGLALIAAAAAARPAASISLLIAAFASLSTFDLFEPERGEDERGRDDDDLEREELLRADFAIALSPSGATERHFNAVPVP
jgi:hypothetical protein